MIHFSDPQPGASGSPDGEHSSLIQNFLDQVHHKIEFANETLEQASDIAVLSKMFASLKDLDKGILKPIRDAGIITFDFHPPVEIPIHTEKAIETIKDDEFNLALTLIGSHVGESFIRNHTSIASQDQVVGNIVMGATLIKPAVIDISTIGYMMYQVLDGFDKTGAVVNGKSMDTVRAIDFQASGPSFHLTRSKIMRTEKMNNTLTLPEIDEWRLRRLAVIGAMSREAGFDKAVLQNLMQGIQLDRIFV